jgi:CheY-like chemotaxis protein
MIPKQAGILLVDPVAIVRKKTASLLVSSGLPKVTGLETPEAALELLETKPCHIIFSDWDYESKTGLEFLRRLRSHKFPRIRNICFVALTADGKKESVDEAMNAGADDYILKPLNANHIQSRINSLLMKVTIDQ